MTPPFQDAPVIPRLRVRDFFRPSVLLLALLLLLPLWLGPDAAAWLSRQAILWRTPLERMGTVPAAAAEEPAGTK